MNDELLAKMERRLQRLEDLEEIRQLKARYLNACDRQNPEAVRDCFVDGQVIIDMSYFGQARSRDEFVDNIFIPRGCHDYVLDLHHGANPEIELISRDKAFGMWSLNYRNINTKEKTVTFMSALYHDEYQKVNDQWKIGNSRTEYRAVLECNYEPGTLQVLTAARSLG